MLSEGCLRCARSSTVRVIMNDMKESGRGRKSSCILSENTPPPILASSRLRTNPSSPTSISMHLPELGGLSPDVGMNSFPEAQLLHFQLNRLLMSTSSLT